MPMGFQTLICLLFALAAAGYLLRGVLAPFLRQDCAPSGCSGCPKAACPALKLQEKLRSVSHPV